MRSPLPLAMLLVSMLVAGCSCHGTQPGCTLENCRTLVSACRVELQGTPQADCFDVAQAPTDFDFAPYCVTACNAESGDGQLIQCLAGKAAECMDAGLNNEAVLETCENLDAGVAEQTCYDACSAARKTCDDVCSGGSACSSCRRQGMTDCPACPDSGFVACTDCSATCGLNFLGCADKCPLQ